MADTRAATTAAPFTLPSGRVRTDVVARWVVAAAAFVAVGLGLAITLRTEQHQPIASAIAQVGIPALVALILLLGRFDRTGPMLAALILLELEAVLAGWLFDVGIAFAILFPLIGIGLAHPVLERGRLSLMYLTAGFAAFGGVWLALTVGSNATALGANAPWLTTLEFGALITIALALLWRAGERRRYATETAQAALDERLAALHEADRVQHTLLALVERSPIATYTLGPDGRIESWNPACETLFGWTDADVVGRPEPDGMWIAAVDDDASPIVVARRRDGREVRVELFATNETTGPDGACRRILQVIDVTAREADELRRRQAARTEAVGMLAGGIAHDFNNMLSAVRGFAVLARCELEADAPGAAELDESIAATDRAARLVRDLLTFSRAHTQGLRLVAPGAQASALAPMLRMLAGKAIEVAVEDASDGATVLIDPGQLDQVLVNLAVNARDAMPTGGRLAIRTTRNDEARTVRIEVADTGTGMDPEVAARVFEPFFTTKGDRGGTGLGLANAVDVVRSAGGRIDVESSKGVGTTFRIDLPLEDEA